MKLDKNQIRSGQKRSKKNVVESRVTADLIHKKKAEFTIPRNSRYNQQDLAKMGIMSEKPEAEEQRNSGNIRRD